MKDQQHQQDGLSPSAASIFQTQQQQCYYTLLLAYLLGTKSVPLGEAHHRTLLPPPPPLRARQDHCNARPRRQIYELRLIRVRTYANGLSQYLSDDVRAAQAFASQQREQNRVSAAQQHATLYLSTRTKLPACRGESPTLARIPRSSSVYSHLRPGRLPLQR